MPPGKDLAVDLAIFSDSRTLRVELLAGGTLRVRQGGKTEQLHTGSHLAVPQAAAHTLTALKEPALVMYEGKNARVGLVGTTLRVFGADHRPSGA